jgi:hypothetical protein
MSSRWHVDARIVGGPATNCAELFDYLRPPQSRTDETATRAEPPRKRQRRSENASNVHEDDIDEADAVLLASEELTLVRAMQSKTTNSMAAKCLFQALRRDVRNT